jgi:hypothetical protein
MSYPALACSTSDSFEVPVAPLPEGADVETGSGISNKSKINNAL